MPITSLNKSVSISFAELPPKINPNSGAMQHPSGQSDITAQAAIDAYQSGVDQLCKALDADGTEAHSALQLFKTFVENETDDSLLTSEREFFETEVVHQFKQFCAFVQDGKLPTETLQKAISDLSKRLGASDSDIASGIAAAAKELHALARGIPNNFNQQLGIEIQYKIRDFLLEQKISIEEKDCAASLFNSVAHEYGLGELPEAMSADLEEREIFQKKFRTEFKVEGVIKNLANVYLERVRALFGSEGEGLITSMRHEEMQKKFDKELRPELDFNYGPVAADNIFLRSAGNEHVYRIADDSTLIAASIARNLRAAGVVDIEVSHAFGDSEKSSVSTPSGALTLPGAHSSQPLSAVTLQPAQKPGVSEAAMRMAAEVAQLRSALRANDGASFDASKEHLKIKDNNGNTLPMLALMVGNTGAAMQMVAQMDGDDFKTQNIYKNTFLALALNMWPDTKVGSPERASLLNIIVSTINHMDAQALEIKNQRGNTALMLALDIGESKFASIMMEKMSVQSLGFKNSDGNTALMISLDWMAKNQREENIQKLMRSLQVYRGGSSKFGEIAKIATVGRRNVPSYMMSSNRLDRIALALIEKMEPEHLNIANSALNTAATIATYRNKTQAAVTLISRMDVATLEIKNEDGRTVSELSEGKKKIHDAICEKTGVPIEPPAQLLSVLRFRD